jgi:hypothetical protein
VLSHLLQRAGIDEDSFWNMGRGQRGRLFLSRYSRVSRDIPQLEISAFDVDKALKERFRQEPLTLGAAWHHGLWRSYFSQPRSRIPPTTGSREEFSTAWDIARRQPAVLFRTGEGIEQLALNTVAHRHADDRRARCRTPTAIAWSWRGSRRSPPPIPTTTCTSARWW